MSLRPGKRARTHPLVGRRRGKTPRALGQLESRIPRGIWSLPLTGFAPQRTVRLRYVEEVFLDPPNLGTASYVFSANGMFDPNISGVGHQPRGFDQNMVMYDHYTVTDSKITVLPASGTTVNISPMYYDVHCQDNSTANVTSFQDLFEKREGSGMLQMAGLITGRNPQGITRYFNSTKFFGKDHNSLIGSSQFQGSALTNPTEQAYWVLYGCSAGANDPTNTSFLVMIDYVAVLTEQKSINAS